MIEHRQFFTALREHGRVTEALAQAEMTWEEYQSRCTADPAFARQVDDAISQGMAARADRLEARADALAMSEKADARLLIFLLKGICPERYGEGAKAGAGEVRTEYVLVNDWPQVD